MSDAAAPTSLGYKATQPDPPGRWAALALLATACFLAMTTWFSAAAVLPQLRAEWKLTAGASALLTIAVQMGFVAGALLSAALNLPDRLAPRRLMFCGALLAAGANFGLVYCAGAGSAMPLRFATGAALALVYPTSLKEMATWFRAGRGMALGVMVGALTLGSALPHLVNAIAATSTSPQAAIMEWRGVVLMTSALTVLGGVLALAGREGPFPFPRATFDPRQVWLVFHNRRVRLTSLGYFGHMWELYAMWTWFGVFFADVLARSSFPPQANEKRALAAIAAFAVIGIGGLGCAAGGALGDRWGRARTNALAMALSGACALLIGWSALPAVVVLLIGLMWGFTVVADSAQFSTLVTEHAEPGYVGTAVTLQLAIGFSLTVLTIWLVPLLREAAGWHAALAVLAPGPALGIVAMRALAVNLRERERHSKIR